MTTEADHTGRASAVDHVALRKAVGAFAQEPGPRGSFEVLRLCMYGELLLDITGSDPNPFAAGASLRIRKGTGPDGKSALFAFTSNEEIARLYPPDTATRSLAQPAREALALAQQHGDAWLYIDPAGPTCALSAEDIDFALRNPNNEALRQALADYGDGLIDRWAVLQVLRQDGPLLLAVDDPVAGKVGIRALDHGGGSSLLAFTSAPEVVAYHLADAVAALTTQQVLDMVSEQGHGGVIVNPAGPDAAFSKTEVFGPLPDQTAGAPEITATPHARSQASSPESCTGQHRRIETAAVTKENNALDAFVAFDTSGLEERSENGIVGWVHPHYRDEITVWHFDKAPDVPAPLDDGAHLRHELAVNAAASGCLIEADVPKLDGVPAVYQLIKVPRPGSPSGQAFVATYTIPRAQSSVVIKVLTMEHGSTGEREAALVHQIGPDNWELPHPYAPEVRGALPFHAGDDAQFDGQFPEHPLTRAREWASRIAATATVNRQFAALPAYTVPHRAADNALAVEQERSPVVEADR